MRELAEKDARVQVVRLDAHRGQSADEVARLLVLAPALNAKLPQEIRESLGVGAGREQEDALPARPALVGARRPFWKFWQR